MLEDIQTTGSSDQQPKFTKYFIDPVRAESTGRSLSVLVESRLCYMCGRAFEEEPNLYLEPQDFIHQIHTHCSQEYDFLRPDTPLKEAIFLVLLAHGNEPMYAEQISLFIGQRWAMTQFPRNTSPEVIQLLMNSSDFYCLAPATDS